MNTVLHAAKKPALLVMLILLCVFSAKSALAQTSRTALYVPLIGITSVPNPLALPNGTGKVTYNYAVKNFLREVALNDVRVVDDKCSPVKFTEGDDNNNSKLDFSETWRYSCTTTLSKTTESIATATGNANNMTATHKAYANVIVGSNIPPPLVSIVNITKVAYPLSLPSQGGDIMFTYKVSNPGIVPLSDVIITDDKCHELSNKLGDTNNNDLLDSNEVWIYTCPTKLKETTTNTASVVAFANGLRAIDSVTLTVQVATALTPASHKPELPITGGESEAGNPYIKITIWIALAVILAILIVVFKMTQKSKSNKPAKTAELPDREKKV